MAERKRILLGEPIFGPTVQGEGLRTGVLSVWLRFAACNLSCRGFFQRDPTKPTTYVNPLYNIDPKSITSVNDLPVMKYGCDTLYAIDPRFKHLFKDYTVDEIVAEVEKLMPYGDWVHPTTGNDIDFCITGGEPLLWQNEIVNICERLHPSYIQIETNGTKETTDKFKEWWAHGNFTLFWNISPKLFHVSGEPADKAWNIYAIEDLWHVSSQGCLKFVINDDDRAWNELSARVVELKQRGINFPIYIMPVSATFEQITDLSVISNIAKRAINEGYHISYRTHVALFGNSVGT